MDWIEEQNRIPVLGSYDVLVVGGGVAEVAAAGAAARASRTLLIEKSISLGGLATIGLIDIYLPLCDGMGHKVTTGIAEELLLLSIRHGYNTLDRAWLTGQATGTAAAMIALSGHIESAANTMNVPVYRRYPPATAHAIVAAAPHWA